MKDGWQDGGTDELSRARKAALERNTPDSGALMCMHQIGAFQWLLNLSNHLKLWKLGHMETYVIFWTPIRQAVYGNMGNLWGL